MAAREQFEHLAQTLSQGNVISETEFRRSEVPPLMLLAISGQNTDGSTLPATLQMASETYLNRGLARAEFLQRTLPIILILVIGGGVTLLYSLLFFGSLIQLWERLGSPTV